MKRFFVALLAAVAAGLAPAAPLSVAPETVSLEVAVHATVDSFTAKLAKADLALAGDPATGAITAAEMKFAWTDLKTGNAKRDAEMLKWAGAEKFPGGRFALAKLERAADGALTATGALELAGQAHELSFPVTVTAEGAGWKVTGETKLDHRTWGLPKIRKFAVLTVDPVVTVRFSLHVAAPAALAPNASPAPVAPAAAPAAP